MERHPEHLKDDPELREEFIAQVSFDEWNEKLCSEIEARGEIELAEDLRQVDNPELVSVWRDQLRPGTNDSEILYLRGYTEKAVRTAIIDRARAERQDTLSKKKYITKEEYDRARRTE
jgi:hypothetical protein